MPISVTPALLHTLADIRWVRITILLGLTLSCLLLKPVEAAEIGSLVSQKENREKKEKAVMSMTITSSSFPNNGAIPARHTCDGHDISPELFWTEIPEGTRSLVLILDDPDAPDPAAPKRTWVHWVLYNIPPDAAGLSEGIATAELPPGTREGLNDWHHTGYGGPCPPVGNHRYFHKLYALDTVLPDLKQPTKAALEKAMHDHIIGYAELIGRYQRH
jgi:Raf kinase inhibitor-like YbhB/YbcL family protein